MEKLFKIKTLVSAVVVATGVALSGCGSSGGGGGSAASSNGLYSGTTTGGLGNPPGGGEKGIIYNNRMMVFATVFDIQQLYNSSLTATDSSFAGTMEVYGNSTSPLLGTADLVGSFVAGVSASFSFSNSTDISVNDGTIELIADTALFNRGSSQATVTGSWQGTHGGLGNSSSIAISAAGDVAGSDVDGCNFTGNVLSAGQSVNVYNVTLVSTGGAGCVDLPVSTYTGFAWTEGTGDTTLNLTVSDGTFSRSVVLTKI